MFSQSCVGGIEFAIWVEGSVMGVSEGEQDLVLSGSIGVPVGGCCSRLFVAVGCLGGIPSHSVSVMSIVASMLTASAGAVC